MGGGWVGVRLGVQVESGEELQGTKRRERGLWLTK
jgi:hypothetical protein